MRTESKTERMGKVVLPKPLPMPPHGLWEENELLFHKGRLEEQSDGVEAVRRERDGQNWGL